MKHQRMRSWAALTALGVGDILRAQAGSGQPAPEDVLQTVDRLIEQNHELEKQNQELMKETVALREMLRTRTATAAANPVATPGPAKEATASATSADTTAEKDARSALPEASDGTPGVVGEFNPGKGFTVARASTEC